MRRRIAWVMFVVVLLGAASASASPELPGGAHDLTLSPRPPSRESSAPTLQGRVGSGARLDLGGTLHASIDETFPLDVVFSQWTRRFTLGERVSVMLSNPNPIPLANAVAEITWLDGSGAALPLKAWCFGGPYIPMPGDGGLGVCSTWVDDSNRPAGAVSMVITAYGSSAVYEEIPLPIELVETSTDADGALWWWYEVSNDQPVPVSPVVMGFEAEGPGDTPTRVIGLPVGGWVEWDYTISPVPADLSYGQTRVYGVAYSAAITPGYNVFAAAWASGSRYINAVYVYRFYNTRTGTHFYTATDDEWAMVVRDLGSTYAYEGVVYVMDRTSPFNTQALYRFYNVRTGTHFYTASDAERDLVLATLGHVYRYDGVAYSVSPVDFGHRTVYRFYNGRTGTHFYTADEAERDQVARDLGWLYSYEGPAFYF